MEELRILDLDLSRNTISSRGVIAITSGLKYLQKLKSLSLNLSENSLVNESYETYQSNLQLKQIFSNLLELRLNFSNNVIGQIFMNTWFGELSEVNALRVFKLNLGKTLADSEIIRQLANFLKR